LISGKTEEDVENQNDLTCSQWQWSVHMQVEVIWLLHFAFAWHADMFDSSFCFGQPASTPS
jgi:hypothetical protein